ncbi:MAG: AAA family ATPase, partial [Gammaproteobacteria bacterium]|nr:AAA family ATPase [Gammaproteobacteria bacterium]
MYARLLPDPDGSILLLGPRGTGKSTWIQSRLPRAHTYNLLDTSESIRLNRDPDALFDELRGLEPGSWVVIDEIQKAPALLDQVH